MSEDFSGQELSPCQIDGRTVRRFLLQGSGLSVELMEWGATVVSVCAKNQLGELSSLTRHLPSHELYADNPAYMGSICGRYAGRIANAKFLLPSKADSIAVQLAANEGVHHLHGGFRGFSSRVWAATAYGSDTEVGVHFNYLSADGEEGYPGTLDTRVTYSLDRAGRLSISYRATALDRATVVNLTNHCYWNLADDQQSSVLGHELALGARSALVFDANLLPTGESESVIGTGLDFARPTAIGAALAKLPAGAQGFDHALHNFVDRGQDGLQRAGQRLPLVAQVSEPTSGRTMRVYSDQPAVVFYTGNALDGATNVGGHVRHSAFCLECQQFPDAPNQPGFPSTLIAQGESYRQTSVYEIVQPNNVQPNNVQPNK